MYGLPRYLITFQKRDKTKPGQELWEGDIPAWMENDYYCSFILNAILINEKDFNELTKGVNIRKDMREKE